MQVCTLLQRDTMPAPYPSVFYRPDALLAAQPTVSKHWRQEPDTDWYVKKLCAEEMRLLGHRLDSWTEGMQFNQTVRCAYCGLDVSDFCCVSALCYCADGGTWMERWRLWLMLRYQARHANRYVVFADTVLQHSEYSLTDIRYPSNTNC